MVKGGDQESGGELFVCVNNVKQMVEGIMDTEVEKRGFVIITDSNNLMEALA